LICHHRFVNASQVLMWDYNILIKSWSKLKNKLKNTIIFYNNNTMYQCHTLKPPNVSLWYVLVVLEARTIPTSAHIILHIVRLV
jgi:hypothetical protein